MVDAPTSRRPVAGITPALFQNLHAETDPFNALTLALEHAETLTFFLGERLVEIGDDEDGECYALSLIAEAIQRKHAFIREKADALLRWRTPRAQKGGA